MTDTSAKAFFDTNVLVYVFDQDDELKQRRARQLFFDHVRSGSFVVSTQVLQEFYWIVTRKSAPPLDPRSALWFVRELPKSDIVAAGAEMVIAAMERSAASGAPFWDALILTAAEAANAVLLFIEDRHMLGLESSVRVVNPFKAD